ncbi:MAG: FAD-binding oxidoreductase [Actinomycetota bacterium]|nr:FAD-binding oxidoreductase [Actinomycetota bacterium]
MSPPPSGGREAPTEPEPVLVSGFGRASASAAVTTLVRSPDHLDELIARRAASGGRALARGLGRAYGDAAQCAGGLVFDCRGLDQVLELDATRGVVRVEAGCSLRALLAAIVPAGWFLPVTPGTAEVTIGGAIAADVHGKNHHRDGTFSAFVDELVLHTPVGRRTLSPADSPEPFFATVAGMGLTGVISQATLRLAPITTSKMVVETRRGADLDQTMEILERADASHHYSVAWVDGVARGRCFGRSVITLGEHAGIEDLPAHQRTDPLAPARARCLPVPPGLPRLISAPLIHAFNATYFRRAPRRATREVLAYPPYFYPLDALADWNRLYGRRGFLQYQYVVPDERADVVRLVFERLIAAGQHPSLVVLKRFGAAGPAPLSFPRPGWTVAIDLLAGTEDLAATLDRVDELVASAGGRVYFAKDGRLRPELVAAMYPELGRWQAARAELDPDGLFVSDLARRLHLVAPEPRFAPGGRDE